MAQASWTRPRIDAVVTTGGATASLSNVKIVSKTPNRYKGATTVDPDFDGIVLETGDKYVEKDITVNPIVVSRTSNPSGGTTVYIGGLIDG